MLLAHGLIAADGIGSLDNLVSCSFARSHNLRCTGVVGRLDQGHGVLFALLGERMGPRGRHPER